MLADMVRDEVTRQIVATPHTVWSLVADATRMAEWSPVITRCEWIGDASGPAVGARFVGHNRQAGARWSRECVITACETGRELAFETLFRGAPSTRWRYRFEPSDAGTRVTESYEVVSMPMWVRALRKVPGMVERSRRDARRGMEVTLERIGAIAETGA
jgi:uncharacterized protein YndB with AHSA1/START domain